MRSAVLIFCLGATSLYALKDLEEQSPYRFYLKQQYYATSFNERDDEGVETAYGWRLGCEALVPNGFYGCAEGSFAFQNAQFKRASSEENSNLSQALTRIGCNLQKGFTFLTPFFEFGGYFLNKREQHIAWAYGAIGSKIQAAILPIFGIGIDSKFMREFYFYDRDSGQGKGSIRWGYQIGLPLTWHIQQSWEVELTPYILQFDFSKPDRTLGADLLLAYRF